MQTEQDYVLEQCENCLMLASCNCGKLKFLTKDKKPDGTTKIADVIERTERVDTVKKGNQQKKAAEVHNCKVQTRNFSGFSIEELAALCVGYGPGIPFAAAGDLSKPRTAIRLDMPDMFLLRLRKRVSSLFFIKTDQLESERQHGQRKC